ncbi:DUF4280 domain-containing protein [Lachnoanaerobaculum orale]|jgi:hypothetical protein|uniref:DUF4280 domain-containing protein n=1 Tax=Lachnoanaerobaculum orale TaxID=979627 RepID=A0A3P3PZ86_9FIRM|nr:DUF4280 domain-containing protein [Lachnoanaerobaculum orale]MBS6729775.1 DUF4280 domain-containing protein [Lachnospiraceae bacterium oral taxon 082]RRJ13410.1 DUF4280 domain-containing protein [Lachnoanaerobaculum orale]
MVTDKRIMPMSDNIDKMYEQQLINGPVSKEYVVRGAEVSCKYGSKTCVLNLSRDHGSYTSDGRPLIMKGDSKPTNISSFGMCNKDKSKPCKCVPKLREWSVIESKKLYIVDPKTNECAEAVTQDSITLCEKGGIVSFKTSGQATPSYGNVKVKGAVEIVEDEKGSWRRPRDKKDFVGHVKVEHSGVYNFVITINETGNRAMGTVYVYSYNILGYVTHIDEYIVKKKIKENGESERYVEVILNRNKDYYFEVDIQNTDKIEYELKGNLDKHRLKIINAVKKEISGVWIIDKKYQDTYKENYDNVVKENKHGITRAIYYLSPWYVVLLGGLIDRIIESGELSTLLSNILNMSITGLGARYTKAGVLLAILLLGFDNLNNYELKRVKNKLQKYIMTNTYLKIEIKNKDYSDRWVYESESLSIWDDKYHYNFSECPALNIGTELEGPKYEKGNFGLLYNFDTSANIEKMIEELKDIASDIINAR